MAEKDLSAASKSALNRLHFTLPLRTTADMSVAEIILQDSPRQYEELCRFLYHILEDNDPELGGGLHDHRPGIVLANALFSTFDLGVLMTLERDCPPSDPRGARMNSKKRVLMAFEPIDSQDEDPRIFRPNPVHICPHVVQAYNIVLKSNEKNKCLEESLVGYGPVSRRLMRDDTDATRELTAYIRRSRGLLLFSWLPQIREIFKSALRMDTVRMTLIEELKLFADAMLKRLGEDYFLVRKQRMISANTFCRTDDWRALANEILRQEDTVDARFGA